MSEGKECTYKEIPCEVVQDLLPLYHDGVVSQVTGEIVKHHLDGCDECRTEYEALSAELPQGGNDSEGARSGFAAMVRRMKKKKILVNVIVAAVVCAVMILIGYFCINVPVVPVSDENIQVIRAYKYELDGKPKVFLMYRAPQYAGASSMKPELTLDGDEVTIEMHYKRTVYNPDVDWDYWGYSNDIYELPGDCRTIKLGNTVIWSEEENGEDEIPDYVYAVEHMNEYEDVNIWCTSGSDNGGFSWIGVEFLDGRRLRWDIDGNVIYDEYPDEDGNYPAMEE